MPSVLVVDDDADVRVLLETYLELEGFVVLTAAGFLIWRALRASHRPAIASDGTPVTECSARVALPTDADDNPWTRRGDRWQP